MRLGSVCSGIGGAELGKPPGWETTFVSEIEKFPREVLAHRFPSLKLYGDFTKIENESVDVLVGGVPCQTFSIAGKRGLDGEERGQLIYKFVDLAKQCGARWFVIENVPGLLASPVFARFLAAATGRVELGDIERLGKAGGVAGTSEGFSVAWRILDARGFGVPQQRRRVWVVGYFGSNWEAPARVLFESESGGGNVAAGEDQPAGNTPEVEDSTHCYSQTLGRYQELEHSPTLTASCAKGASHTPLVITNGSIRYVTELECERLQGFPAGWTDIPGATKTKRYKALGNAFVPAVCLWVLKRIQKQEQLTEDNNVET